MEVKRLTLVSGRLASSGDRVTIPANPSRVSLAIGSSGGGQKRWNLYIDSVSNLNFIAGYAGNPGNFYNIDKDKFGDLPGRRFVVEALPTLGGSESISVIETVEL